MQSIFLLVHILAAAGLIGLVLLQHGRGADAGAAFGSGSSGTLFGARGPATFLTRITAFLAATFFITSLSLAYLSGQNIERKSVVERVQPAEQEGAEPRSESPTDVPSAPGSTGFDVPSVPDAPVPQTDISGTDVPAAPESAGGAQ